MNEFEWLYGGDPKQMLRDLGARGGKRKLQLFWGACLREQGRGDEAEMIERFADGFATKSDLIAAPGEQWLSAEDAWYRAVKACDLGDEAHEERLRRCAWVRDLFGNPFRPRSLNAAWLHWNDGAVRKTVRTIYDEGRFADLPLLADALEEAGCDDAFLLHHCRQAGGHVRGCWAVDLLTGRG
jgi:hypothetical protein